MYKDLEKQKAYSKQWRRNNKPRVQEYRKGYRFKYNKYKARSKKRGIAFLLSFEEFIALTSGVCCYCGATKCGIDRINSAKPYIKDNCVSCCYICNVMKNDLSLDVFIEHLKKILEYRKTNEQNTL